MATHMIHIFVCNLLHVPSSRLGQIHVQFKKNPNNWLRIKKDSDSEKWFLYFQECRQVIREFHSTMLLWSYTVAKLFLKTYCHQRLVSNSIFCHRRIGNRWKSRSIAENKYLNYTFNRDLFMKKSFGGFQTAKRKSVYITGWTKADEELTSGVS